MLLTQLPKLVVQKALGLVPGAHVLQEGFKRWSGHWDKRITPELVEAQLAKNARTFRKVGTPLPEVVLEQGTGWHGVDLIFFVLAGAREIHTYDVRRWFQRPLFDRCVKWALSHLDVIETIPDVSPRSLRIRADRLRSVVEEGGALDELGIRYSVTVRMDRPSLEGGSVGLFYSDSVLQRMLPMELEALLREARRVLNPRGLAIHRVDCRDFHRKDRPDTNQLDYLVVPPFLWRMITSKYLNYQNQLRLQDFADLFRELGFHVSIHDEIVTPANLNFARSTLSRHPRYRHLDPEEAAVSSFTLYGQLAEG